MKSSIRTSLLQAVFLVVVALSLTNVVIFIMHFIVVESYKATYSNMISEYRLIDATQNLISAYNDRFRNINVQDPKSEKAISSAKNQISILIKALDKNITNKDSVISYLGLKNTITKIIKEIDDGLVILAKGQVVGASGYYDEANRDFLFAKDNWSQLLLNELNYTNTLQDRLNLTNNLSVIIGLFILIVIVAGSIIYVLSFSKKLVIPLEKLTTLAKQISQGDMEVTMDQSLLEKTDETGSLSKSFDSMVKQLREKMATERHAKEEVERALKNANALQQTIKEERDRARGIVTSMGEGLIVVDKNMKVVLMNPAAERLLEVSGQDAIGKNIQEVVIKILGGGKELAPQERPSARTLAGASMNIGIEDNYSFKLISGRELPVALATTPLRGDGGITGVVEVFRDITAEKQSRTAIEQQVIERTKELQDKNVALTAAKEEISRGWLQIQMEKARLLASVNSITLGFLMLDVNGKTLLKNPAVEKAIGIKSDYSNVDIIDQLLGRSFAIKEKFNKCVEERTPINDNNVNFNNRFFRLFMAPIYSTDNTLTVIGVVILIQDETEQKILDRSKDEFFSIASHELRTPLTAIRGNTALIEQYFGEKLAVEPELKSMIDDIHASSVRLIQIVNDFLNVSRLEQGRMEYKIENFDLPQLIDKKIEEISSLSLEKHIPIVFQRPTSPLPAAFADKDRVGEVLLNLFGNAIKYSEKGSVTVQTFLLQGFIKVSVTDTGKGIPPEQQSLLFHKFQQAGSSILTRDTTRATGLGLYISKMLTEQMGGQIFLEKSVPNVGSTFSFTVPIQQVTAATVPLPGVPPAMPQGIPSQTVSNGIAKQQTYN